VEVPEAALLRAHAALTLTLAGGAWFVPPGVKPLRAVLLAIGLAFAPAGRTWAASAGTCASLGDRLLGRLDTDSVTVDAVAGERIQIAVEATPDASNRGGGRARLSVVPGAGVRGRSAAAGGLPLALDVRAVRAGTLTIRVRALGRGRSTGAYCVSIVSSGGAADSLSPAPDVEVPWVPLAADRGSVFPPFERVAAGEWGGLIQPVVPLVGARVYGVIVTARVRDTAGRPLEPDAAFLALRGGGHRSRSGPVARYDADPEASGNPYPEARLVRPDGTIRVPDHVALRGLDGADPALASARAELRATADALGQLGGFSTTAPIEIALSRPADITTVTPASVLVFARTDGRLDLDSLLREAGRHGVRRHDIALAISFPTQDVEAGHRAVRARLLALAASSPFGAILNDPDPADDLPLGVFDRTSQTFASFLAATPQVAKVVAGLLPAREFRDARGLFDPARLAGDAAPPVVPLDFLLTIPTTGTPPYPVVIFQHGFAGSNAQVLSRVSAVLAEHGLATIGISAASHGRRGSPLDLLTGTPFQLRDIFRQTNADQMALVRMLEAGVDVDRDGVPDLDASRIGYLGISLGGITGGPFVATEAGIGAAVLNVMSGRTALNGLNAGTRPIFASYLATRVGLPETGARFEAYLARFVALGQHAADAADALNFARRWTQQPFPGYAPRRILMQEGVGDALVFNALTEELAAVAGLARNQPRMDAGGVSGLWIFQPPGGHGIFDQRAEVRTQAASFLASGGVLIDDPGVP